MRDLGSRLQGHPATLEKLPGSINPKRDSNWQYRTSYEEVNGDYKEEAVGSIYDGEQLITLLENAHKEKDFFSEKTSELCNDCPWWFFCKGGCTTAIKYKKGTVTGVDAAECGSNRTLYPELVKLILNEPEMVKVLTKNKLEII